MSLFSYFQRFTAMASTFISDPTFCYIFLFPFSSQPEMFDGWSRADRKQQSRGTTISTMLR
jgi:hypothetical protein